MSTSTKRFGASLAAAVAVSFLVALPTTSSAKNTSVVICPGVNSCKGTSDCKMYSSGCHMINQCKRQNDCKGTGFLRLSKAECVKRGSRGIEDPIYMVPPEE